MKHKVNHTVLAYICNNRHAEGGHCQQEARDAAKSTCDVNNGSPRAMHPMIQTHVIFPMPIVVAEQKDQKQHKREKHKSLPGHFMHQPVPALTQIEEINSHKNIAQTHPHFYIVFRHQPTDKREKQSKKRKVGNLLHEMHQDIHTEERKQEPNRRIAIEMALHPNVTPFHLVPIHMQWFRKKAENAKIEYTAYGAPCKIGNNETFELVLQEETGRSGNALVEITCLEEEETDEEKCPCHQLIKPHGASPEPAHTYTMQRYHPKNTKTAKQIKSLIPLFHAAKLHKKRIIDIIMNYEL